MHAHEDDFQLVACGSRSNCTWHENDHRLSPGHGFSHLQLGQSKLLKSWISLRYLRALSARRDLFNLAVGLLRPYVNCRCEFCSSGPARFHGFAVNCCFGPFVSRRESTHGTLSCVTRSALFLSAAHTVKICVAFLSPTVYFTIAPSLKRLYPMPMLKHG